jgi:hypothetical protein
MKKRLHFIAIFLILLVLVLLASCATAATQSPTQPAPTLAPLSTATQAGAPTTPEPTGVFPTQPPLGTPTQPGARPTPTAGPITAPTQGPYAEQRMLELEWPASLRLGESDLVRLSIVPYQGGYQVTAEFPEHTVQSQQVTVTRVAGYVLSGVARLDGVGFEIAPGGEQEQPLPVDQVVTWRWTLRPRAPGQQRLSILLTLRWTPEGGGPGSVRQAPVFSRGLDVRVSSFLGLSQPQAMAAGFWGLLVGLGLSLGAVILRPASTRARLHTVVPNPALVVEPVPGMQLSGEETGLFKALFGRYSRLVIENEFLSGYSGARTFLVLPVKVDGHADAQTIVKIGWRADIQREAENYETFVKDSLPPMTARIQRAPIAAAGSRRAAVQYTFIAEPGHPPLSLRQSLLENPDPALLFRLFDTFGPGWWMQRRASPFRVSSEYDLLLPPHLVLEPWPGSGIPQQTLSETSLPYEIALSPGDIVSLGRFSRCELRADGSSYSLYGSLHPGQPALRARWLNAAPPRPQLARVVDTRGTLFAALVGGMELFRLPNPLEHLPALLSETLQGTRSIIHGDLNLENVLVGPGGFVWLIDFAQTREGHPLFDFSHLAAEIIAHIIAPGVASPQDYLGMLESGQQPLLSAVRAIAQRCLFNPSDEREYWISLLFACLGALKYPNLGAKEKRLLYLTAAWVSSRL